MRDTKQPPATGLGSGGQQEQATDRLIAVARKQGDRVEDLRQQMMAAARLRQATVLQLHRGGLSVRQLAAALGVSASVVQHAITAARGDSGPLNGGVGAHVQGT